jgi:hypothetical protein
MIQQHKRNLSLIPLGEYLEHLIHLSSPQPPSREKHLKKSKPLGLNRRRVNATNARNPGYLVITKESVSHDSN